MGRLFFKYTIKSSRIEHHILSKQLCNHLNIIFIEGFVELGKINSTRNDTFHSNKCQNDDA